MGLGFDLLGMFRREPPADPVGTYTTWSWPATAAGYNEMRWELEPRTDPSPVGYFWSHQVALVGGQAAYFGLQTMGAQPTGKIAIFSIWNAIEADGPDYVAPFGGEGTGMSVRIPYEWAPGRPEQLAIRADGDGDRDGGGWWRAEVGDQLVGRIRVDPTWGGLASTSIMWTERYAPPLRRCADVGHAVAWFGTPQADGGVAPQRHRNHLGTNHHRGCPGSWVEDEEGGIVQIMGAP